MVLRSLFCMLALFATLVNGTVAGDLRPLDHGLRYVGQDGIIPVIVEVTLRERPDGTYEYVQWVMPRSWASWWRRDTMLKARLQLRDELLVPLGLDTGTGVQRPPANLPAGALDAFSVRLRARADIARGVKQTQYTVWNGDDGYETWTLEVAGADTVVTPDGAYQSLKFRLGSESRWIEGWSAPLLVFHFVKIDCWRDGRKVAELKLDDKQL